MSVSGRSFRGRNLNNAERPENIGNRRTFDEVKVPPDNIGNKDSGEYFADFNDDNEGNSLDEEPTHLKSGILSKLVSSGARPHRNRRYANNQSQPRVEAPRSNAIPDAERHMARLKDDFAKLLKERSGLPFSFSMKPMSDADFKRVDLVIEDLNKVGNLIEEILQSNTIEADISLSQYRTMSHQFAVFFIRPTETDSVKNKELIAALRQVVNAYANRAIKAHINIFLVLANAKTVIEDHLTKIGAKKLDDRT